MLIIDMTAQLAPIFHGMVALLTLSAAAITANACGTNLKDLFLHYSRRTKPRAARRPSIVPASA